MTVISFANIDGSSFQTPNPGGIRQLFVAIAKDIVGVWPNYKTDVSAGEITTLPVMKTGKKFAKYECPDGTVEVNSDDGGDPGYQSSKHMINFATAGFSKALTAELAKHKNAGSIYIVEQNDGQYCVVGSTDNPIFLKKSFKSGKKGNDKRGFESKGEADGFMFDILPLDPTLIEDLEILADV